MERVKINLWQLTILVMLVTIGDAILVLPSIPAFEAKQDAWISSIIGLVAGLLIIWLFCRTGKLYPHKNLVEYTDIILGKWLGSAVSFAFLIYPLFSIAAHVREVGDFMTTHIMPETPIHAIHILFLLIIIMGARAGLEVIIRSSEVLFPLVCFTFYSIRYFSSSRCPVEKYAADI